MTLHVTNRAGERVEVKRDAVISADKVYRYLLTRRWEDDLPVLAWCMLNPSTADADSDDPTIERCIGFARVWGYGGIDVVNAYALRATDPRELRRVELSVAIGPENREYLLEAATRPMVVAAWGSRADKDTAWRARSTLVEAGANLHCLGRNKDGQPKHPLYLAASTRLEEYRS